MKEKIKLLHFAKLLEELEEVVPEGERRHLLHLAVLGKQGHTHRHTFHTQPHQPGLPLLHSLSPHVDILTHLEQPEYLCLLSL